MSLETALEQLKNPDREEQKAGISTLAMLADPQAVMPLAVWIYSLDEDPANDKNRAQALKALANSLTGAEIGLLDSLLPFAQSKSVEVKAATLLCLGRIFDPEGKALKAIILGLLSSSKEVVEASAVALSEGFRGEPAHLLRFLVDVYVKPDLPDFVYEALLIAFSRVSIQDPLLRATLRKWVLRDLSSKSENIQKTAIVVLEGLYDDENPVPDGVTKKVMEIFLNASEAIQMVAASFLTKCIRKR